MGVNLAALCSLPGSLGSSRSPGRPPGSSGRPERRSSLQQQDLSVITNYYRAKVQDCTKLLK